MTFLNKPIISTVNMNQIVPQVTLSVYKNHRQTYPLFDFDTPITQDLFILNSTSLVYRKTQMQPIGKQVRVVSQQQAAKGDLPDYSFGLLFGMRVQRGSGQLEYIVDKPDEVQAANQPNLEMLDKMPFVCLSHKNRQNQLRKMKIKTGDIFKLGRLVFKVLQTHQHPNQAASVPLDQDILQLECRKQRNSSRIEQQPRICRICLQDDDQDDMVSPCACRGSCQHVHMACLKRWIQTKVAVDESPSVSTYTLSKLQCQLCKTRLPSRIQKDNILHTLVEFKRPSQPFLVIQKLQRNPQERSVYVLQPGEQEVRIGRGYDMGIRLADISVSRMHASISMQNGQFFLNDKGSKFGSLLLMRQAMKIQGGLSLQLQGRMYKMEIMGNRQPWQPQANFSPRVPRTDRLII